MFGRQRRGGATGRLSLPIIMLIMQMMRVGFDHIPPVTLTTILAQLGIFMRLIRLPRVKDVCISAAGVWYYEDWQRLLYGSFFHVNDWHLYYNMVSFLWKGLSLERRLGSKYFAYLIGVFAVLTSAMMVALALVAEEWTGDSQYIYQCAAGFSGVLFALKVVTTHMLPPGIQYLMGFIPIHSKFACWAELLLIHILVPNASFMGHLAGILVGLLYVKGPLKYIMDIPFDLFVAPTPSYTHGARSTGRQSRGWGQFFTGSGTTGQSNNHQNPGHPQNPRHPQYEAYTGGLSEEEQLQRVLRESMPQGQTQPGRARYTQPTAPPMEEDGGYGYNTQNGRAAPAPSMPQPPPGPPPTGPPPAYERLYPDLRNVDQDEIRRRRLQRFDSRS